MDFSTSEKRAMVKAIAQTIELDEQYKVGELMYLDQLMDVLEFDATFLEEAKKLSAEEAVSILKDMSVPKKKALIIMIDEMSEADGSVHEKEADFIVNLINILR